MRVSLSLAVSLTLPPLQIRKREKKKSGINRNLHTEVNTASFFFFLISFVFRAFRLKTLKENGPELSESCHLIIARKQTEREKAESLVSATALLSSALRFSFPPFFSPAAVFARFRFVLKRWIGSRKCMSNARLRLAASFPAGESIGGSLIEMTAPSSEQDRVRDVWEKASLVRGFDFLSYARLLVCDVS